MTLEAPLLPRRADFWTPLPPSTSDRFFIRLLTVLPGSDGSRLDCKLDIVSLHPDGPSEGRTTREYEALSYCCGDQSIQVTIACNNALLRIGRNLHDALNRLRYADKERVLWVDEICVDQVNLKEKAYQVSQMGRIYAFAQGVMVHLGNNTYGEAAALNIFRDLDSQLDQHLGYSTKLQVHELTREDVMKALPVFQTAMRSLGQNQEIVQQFMMLPYWERLWPVQELTLARHVTFLCGTDTAPFKPIATGLFFAHLLMPRDESHRDDGQRTERNPESQVRRATREHVQSFLSVFNQRHGDKLKLKALFNIARFQDYKFAVDKVYAVASLLQRANDKILIQPDYTLDPMDVFTQVSNLIMQCDENLDIMSEAPSKRPELPSWVPDWDPPPGSVTRCSAVLRLQQFQACGGSGLSIEFHGGRLSLRCQFLTQLRRITGIGKKSPEGVVGAQPIVSDLQTSFEEDFEDGREWYMFLASLDQFFQFAERIQSSPWKVLSVYDEHHLDSTETECQSGYNAVRAFSEQVARDVDKGRLQSWLSVFVHGWKYNFRSGSLRPLDFESRVYLEGRRLAQGADGKLMNVPGDAEVGDHVVLLKGGRVPYVLKKEGGCYRLVGDCYVDGVMYGEAWDESKCSNIELS